MWLKNMKSFIWFKVKSKGVVSYLAGKNPLMIFIITSALINLFPFVMLVSYFLEGYDESSGLYDSSFLTGLLLQQCFFFLVMVFTLIEVSKVNIKPLHQAFIFVVLWVLIKILLSIYSYVILGFSIGSIDYIRLVTSSMLLWFYYYILSWFCFIVVDKSSQVKKE